MANKTGLKKGIGWGLLVMFGGMFLYNLGSHSDSPASSPAGNGDAPLSPNSVLSTAPLDPVITGHVLPFKIVQAVRNYSFKGGPQAQISVMVDGGERSDWAATGTSIARAAMRSDVTSATVRVIQDNPWGDAPPTEYKSLADVYVDPSLKDNKSNSGFDVILADKMAPMELMWTAVQTQCFTRASLCDFQSLFFVLPAG